MQLPDPFLILEQERQFNNFDWDNMDQIIAYGIILLIVYLFTITLLVTVKNDNSIANFTWGGGCLLLALYTFFSASQYLSRQILITILITLWSLRLINYLYVRYTGKDPRFKDWNQLTGMHAFIRSFLYIFLGQGILLLIMAYPAVFINITNTPGLTALDIVALIIWAIGFLFESIGDYQLFTFIKNPENHGKVMRYGLWRYTRHPNYFGEITMWWGIFLIALSVPYGYTAIISPLTIGTLLIFFTGIPWTEAVFKDNPEFQEYKKHTSMLIPLPPY